jgi:hypothetical protein
MTDKQAMFDVGIYLIAMSDGTQDQAMIKKAIEELQNIITVRQNVPF